MLSSVCMKAKTKTTEFRVFENALRDVLHVSKADLNRMLADEKRMNEGKPKRGPKPKRPSTSGHGVSDKD